MKFPITLSFKLLSLTTHIQILSASGDLLGFAKQKWFKLKEDLRIFSPSEVELYNIQANKIWDFSPTYTISRSHHDTVLGTISRQGVRSIWSAHYNITCNDGAYQNKVLEVHEEDPWTKFFDAWLGSIPILGMLTGYVFNPAYIISAAGTPIARLQKQPAFWEGQFELSSVKELDDQTKEILTLSSLVVLIMERSRG